MKYLSHKLKANETGKTPPARANQLKVIAKENNGLFKYTKDTRRFNKGFSRPYQPSPTLLFNL